jgi:hypothetical protein
MTEEEKEKLFTNKPEKKSQIISTNQNNKRKQNKTNLIS